MKLKNKKGDNRISDFLRYKQGKMSGWERNAFEREMQKDPFAAEAEEGFSELAAENIVSDLEFLEKKLKRRVSRRSRAVFYSIAASVTVLMILSSVFVVIDKKHSSKEDTAGFKEKAMEITVSKAVRKPETHAAEPSKPVETVRTDAGSIRPQEEKKAEITEDKGNEPNKPGAGPGKGPLPPTERAASLTSVQQKEAKSEETNKPVASPVTLKAARRYGKGT